MIVTPVISIKCIRVSITIGILQVQIIYQQNSIDSEIYPRLFTKFTSKSFQGPGLELYICKSIVEAHGGKIWAKNNEDGKGATFSFRLHLYN